MEKFTTLSGNGKIEQFIFDYNQGTVEFSREYFAQAVDSAYSEALGTLNTKKIAGYEYLLQTSTDGKVMSVYTRELDTDSLTSQVNNVLIPWVDSKKSKDTPLVFSEPNEPVWITELKFYFYTKK